jgi:hypothetical protein
MRPLSRSGFWLSAALLLGLVVLMLVLFLATSSFGSDSTDGERISHVTVTCSSVAKGAHDVPRGLTVSGTSTQGDELAWADHCATTRSQRTGWLALLAVPTAVLAVLCLVRRPEQLIGRPRVKPKLGPLYTPSIE